MRQPNANKFIASLKKSSKTFYLPIYLLSEHLETLAKC